MQFEAIADLLRGIPYTPPPLGRRLYEFVQENRVSRILELGFAHGVSTCYMAAALSANGSGSILTIDDHSARDRDPSDP